MGSHLPHAPPPPGLGQVLRPTGCWGVAGEQRWHLISLLTLTAPAVVMEGERLAAQALSASLSANLGGTWHSGSTAH